MESCRVSARGRCRPFQSHLNDQEYQRYLEHDFPGRNAINEKWRAWFCTRENMLHKRRVVNYAASNRLDPGRPAFACRTFFEMR
jgi:hypothetical protein